MTKTTSSWVYAMDEEEAIYRSNLNRDAMGEGSLYGSWDSEEDAIFDGRDPELRKACSILDNEKLFRVSRVVSAHEVTK